MLHKWHYIYILCCCNSLHRQVVPVASEHADVRVFSPSAPTNRSHQLKATYRRHERRVYEQSVQEVERASFTSLVFAASGGMGKATAVFYKQLAALLAQKRHQPYVSSNHALDLMVSEGCLGH